MTNHLAQENSPYLLQHAENPVNWYPWGAAALEKARLEDKPIFLSVGYAACHWCHVMAHESFEDEATAQLMNQYFVNIKVDREERPDIDSIYMQAVVAITGQGGWPMSVFITPEGQPFFGGTYFPPVRRYNMASFTEILTTVARLWQEDRGQLLESGQKISQHLSQQIGTAPGTQSQKLQKENLSQAVQTLAQGYDWQNGGWGQAPKFPQPMIIAYLLRRSTAGDQTALDMATHALKSMAKGGMYDVVGGGFARYSVDNRWQIPHFEKMLYDNAQLAQVYLHAYQITGDESFRRVCEETLDFVRREMTHPMGGFYSSLDADSEGVEGKFYSWSATEIQQRLEEEAPFFSAAYGVTATGNFEGENVLQRVLDDGALADKFNLPRKEVPARLAELHAKLLHARSERIRPGTDDKVLVFWNAMMLTAFAEAGRYLKREDYTQIAIQNATFLHQHLYQHQRLLRSWRAGQAKYNAYLEDYAGLILSLIAIYQTDPDARWYQFALKLADEMIAHFTDPNGGFFDTRDDHEDLLFRPKDLQDNATPSGNGLAALALLQLAAYGDRIAYREIAEKMLAALQNTITRYPTAFAQWLCAADFALAPVKEVALLGNFEQMQPLRDTLWQTYQPNLVAAISLYPPDKNGPQLLKNRPLQHNQPTAYVCQGFVCQQPVISVAELNAQLKP